MSRGNFSPPKNDDLTNKKNEHKSRDLFFGPNAFRNSNERGRY